MKIKLLALFTTTAMFLATPAIANPPDHPQLNFSCQVTEGVPTTIAQFVGSEVQLPIFHWKPEVLTMNLPDTPEQLCNLVAKKLEDYSAQGYDLSRINFIGTQQNNLPILCANVGGSNCSKVLLTLRPVEQPALVADNLVNTILDENLRLKKSEYRSTEVQSISYQVDFWSLLESKPKLSGR